MNLYELFSDAHVLSTPDVAKAFDMSEAHVREWAEKLNVTKIGASFAWTLKDLEALNDKVKRPEGPAPEQIGRLGFSVAEAARALGKRPDALRRTIERVRVDEGEEFVARLTGGIVARKRKGMGRWMVVIPADLRNA